MAKKSSSKIKNVPQYEALREKGMSKEKAARIANTQNPDYNSVPYEDRTREQLYQKAKEVGIPKSSKMKKADLIKALRAH
jgi:hypothetical protein